MGGFIDNSQYQNNHRLQVDALVIVLVVPPQFVQNPTDCLPILCQRFSFLGLLGVSFQSPHAPHPSAGRVGQGDVGRWTGGRGEPIVGRRPVKEQLLLWRRAVSVAHRDTQSCRAARCLCPAPRARLCGGGGASTPPHILPAPHKEYSH